MIEPNSTFGCYRVGHLLGSGATGHVFHAIDTRLDREVALKIIRPELAGSQDYRQRLATEAKAAAKIDSPYVVRVWEYSVLDDVPFLSLEYVAGEELGVAITGLDLESRLAIAHRVAEGIAAAHATNVIHGDLKPENIKLTMAKSPKILDFGLAKPARQSAIDERGKISGTLHYLAPEQLSGAPSSTAGDIFAFGVILYELVSNRKPFDGEFPSSVAYSILHEDPVSPGELNSAVPRWLNSLILSLLVKKREERPATIEEVVRPLEQHLSGYLVSPRREISGRPRNVTVIDLRNRSGDSSWDYFCEGFTDDMVDELSRHTSLVVSAQPATDLPRDMREIFNRFRSDFVVSGSLMQWKGRFQLRLAVHADRGERLVSNNKYERPAAELFELLEHAVREIAIVLQQETGVQPVEVPETPKTDITAYDYYLQGKSYYQTNKPDALEFARGMFEKALSVDPGYALAHTGLADLFVFQYMAYYDRTRERMDEARTQAGLALEIDPDLPEAHRSLGRYHMFLGNLKEAKTCFTKAVELNPKYAVGFRTLAWLKYQEREFTASLDWAQKALLLAPTDTETLLLIGQLHTYGRDYTAATATLQRAVEIAPDYGRAHYNLGLVCMKLGALDPAIEHYQSAAKYRGDPNCLIDAGWAYFLKGDLDQARKSLSSSVDEGFFPFVAQYCLGFIEAKCDNTEGAREYFLQAVEYLRGIDYTDRENVQMQGYYALVLAALGETDAARDQLEDITECDNLIGDVLQNVARCYAMLGDKPDAQMYLQQALQVAPGPTNAEVALDPHFESLRL